MTPVVKNAFVGHVLLLSLVQFPFVAGSVKGKTSSKTQKLQ